MKPWYAHPFFIIGASLFAFVTLIFVAVALFTAGTPSKQTLATVQQSGDGIAGIEEIAASYKPDSACEALCKKYSVDITVSSALSDDGASLLFQRIATANARVTKPMQLCFRYPFKSPNMDKDLEQEQARKIFSLNGIDTGQGAQCEYLTYDKSTKTLVSKTTHESTSSDQSCNDKDPCSLEPKIIALPWVMSVNTDGGSYKEVLVRVTTTEDIVSTAQLETLSEIVRSYTRGRASLPDAYIVVRKSSNPQERLSLTEMARELGSGEVIDDGTILKISPLKYKI